VASEDDRKSLPEDPLSASSQSGTSLPGDERYEILGELGRGTAGVVYRARDRVTDVVVAVKMLGGSATPTAKMVRRFRRELQAAWKVTHPGVVRIHDLVQLGGHLGLSMELVEGESLEHRLSRPPPLSGPELTQIAIDLARALAAAHRQGVTHRDLKPANVMVRASNGRAVITDFGVSRLAEAQALAESPPAADAAPSAATGEEPRERALHLTEEGTLIGTPLYMAPEQLLGRGDIGPPADIYAYGVVLYEAATGKRPHDARTIGELTRARLRPPPPLARADLPAPLCRVIDRCLAPDPTQRFADGDALRAALDAAVRPDRRRSFVIGGAALLVVLLLGGGLFVRALRRAPPIAAKPAAPRSSWIARSSTLSTRTENLDRGGVSSDGRWMALPSTRGGPWELWLIDLKTRQWTRAPHQKRFAMRPRFVDGDRAVVAGAEGALWRLPLTASAAPTELVATPLSFFDVMPGQKRVLFASSTSELSMVDVDTRAVTTAYRFGDTRGFGDVEIAPDGRHALVSRLVEEVDRGGSSGELRCALFELDLAARRVTPVASVGIGTCGALYVPNEPGAIVVSLRRGGPPALWKQFLDGRPAIQLTSGAGGDDVLPTVSPDGNDLYYLHDTTRTQLFIATPKERSWRTLTDDLNDHDAVAFDATGGALWSIVIDRDSNERALTRRTGPTLDTMQPIAGVVPQDYAVAADGKEAIVVDARGGAHRLRFDGAAPAVVDLPLRGLPKACSGISWSPDRARLALARLQTPTGLFVIPVDGGGSSEVASGAWCGAAFSPVDPNLLAGVRTTPAGPIVTLVDLRTRALRPLGKADASSISNIAWSPTGDAIYYASLDQNRLARINVKSGAVRLRDAPGDQLYSLAVRRDGAIVAASSGGRARLIAIENLHDAR
jgi:serine/threonine protein kinase